MCSGHHHAAHAGLIEITGEAPHFSVRRVPAAASARPARADRRGAPDAAPHGGRDVEAATHGGHVTPTSCAQGSSDTVAAEAIGGLRQMGFGRGEATRAVGEAMTAARATMNEPTLQAVIVSALRSLGTNGG